MASSVGRLPKSSFHQCGQRSSVALEPHPQLSSIEGCAFLTFTSLLSIVVPSSVEALGGLFLRLLQRSHLARFPIFRQLNPKQLAAVYRCYQFAFHCHLQVFAPSGSRPLSCF
jgi:hypothetical protein